MKPFESNPQGDLPPTAVVPTYSDGQNNVPPQPQPKKSSWKRITIIVAIVIAVLGIGGGIAYYFFNKSMAEEQAFENLKGSYVIKDYEDYLSKYPDGENARKVEKRLGELKQLQAAWSLIEHSSNTQDFASFKSQFNDGHYDVLCDNKIDSLDWVRTLSANTIEAYQLYLSNHPKGRYVQMAQTAMVQAEQDNISIEVEENIYISLVNFYSAFERNDGKEMCSYITPVMDNFLGKSQATKGDVLTLVENMFTPSIEECSFSLGRDFKVERIKNGNQPNGYKVTFSIDQHIKRSDAGKTFGSYIGEATFNEQFMMSSLMMREISSKKSENPDSFFDW